MYLSEQQQKAFNKAKELDNSVVLSTDGINWHWVTGFKSREVANNWVNYLDKEGIDNRGVYSDKNEYNVRFR